MGEYTLAVTTANWWATYSLKKKKKKKLIREASEIQTAQFKRRPVYISWPKNEEIENFTWNMGRVSPVTIWLWKLPMSGYMLYRYLSSHIIHKNIEYFVFWLGMQKSLISLWAKFNFDFSFMKSTAHSRSSIEIWRFEDAPLWSDCDWVIEYCIMLTFFWPYRANNFT